MITAAKSNYSEAQLTAWLRGLLTIAWSDDDYEEQEQELITQIAHDLAITKDPVALKQPITPKALAEALGSDPKTGENFLRTAVMVAVADGTYSTPESQLLHQFSDALGIKVEAFKSLEQTLYQPKENPTTGIQAPQELPDVDLLHPIKNWLDGMDVDDPRLAKFICKMIPPQCPFERDVKLFGHKIVHIPPLCKINPLYEQLIGLRFRSLSYLADDCKEDISEFI